MIWIVPSCDLVLKAQIRRREKECALDAVSAVELGEVWELAMFAFFLFVALRGHSMGKRQETMERESWD